MAVLFNSNFDQTIPFSDATAQVTLGAAVQQTYTVPGTSADKYTALFTYTSASNVYVRLNATPTVAGAGSVGTEQGTEFRPGSDGSKRYVKGGDVIHLITPDATAYVGIRLMSLLA